MWITQRAGSVARRRRHRLADRQPVPVRRVAKFLARVPDRFATTPMDGPVDAAAAHERPVGRVDDRIDVLGGDVSQRQNDTRHVRIVRVVTCMNGERRDVLRPNRHRGVRRTDLRTCAHSGQRRTIEHRSSAVGAGRRAKEYRMRRSIVLVAAAALAVALAVPIAAGAATVPAPVACNTSQGACWHPVAGQPVAVPAAGRRGLCVDRRHQREHQRACRSPAAPRSGRIGVRHRRLRRSRRSAGNNTTLNTAAVNAIHANGAKAICYVSAGTLEHWRPDAASFPASVRVGGRLAGMRSGSTSGRRAILLPIMQARVQKCQAGRVRRRGVGHRRRVHEPERLPAHRRRTSSSTTRALANLAHPTG